MDSKEFRRFGYEMIEFVAKYMEEMAASKRYPLPSVHPGYLAEIMPSSAPEKGEKWEDVMKDIEPIVLTGMTHWQHPNFHAYFPAGNSWPAVLGGIFINGMGAMAHSWNSCPVATELEIIVLDWVAKFLDLPKYFLSRFSDPSSLGGGCIQGSASEGIMIAMISAREEAVKKLRKKYPKKPRAVLLEMLIAYSNCQCHSSVEKATMIAEINLRELNPDDSGSVRGKTLQNAITEDIGKGLIPFYFCAILGSTGICVFDDLTELGPICKANDMYLHVDGAYAGSCFSCPEMRYLKAGLEYGNSFNINCNKWMLTSFDCSILWVKDLAVLTDACSGNDQSLHNQLVTDFQFCQIQYSRRFRAFKLWAVIRTYGVEGIRKYQRNHIRMAKLFESFLLTDHRFEIVGTTRVGLCCFRLKGTNDLNKRLLEALNASKKIHMVPSVWKEHYIIRFAPTYEFLTAEHVEFSWSVVREYTTVVIHLYEIEMKDREKHHHMHLSMPDLLKLQAEIDLKKGEKSVMEVDEEKQIGHVVSKLNAHRGSVDEFIYFDVAEVNELIMTHTMTVTVDEHEEETSSMLENLSECSVLQNVENL